MQTSLRDLKSKGFVSLTYPQQLREAVAKTVMSWEKFCALPLEIKTGLPYSNGGAGVGYEFKTGAGPKGDRKENFDATRAGKDWLAKNAENIGSADALAFIEDATSLTDIAKPLILSFAQQVEEEFGIKGFRDEVNDSADSFFFRFIHYAGDREIGEETATAHVDQSGFTLHLFESDPGLQCLSYEGEWMDMPVSEGETVIIPAMQLQLRSEGSLRALCHRVIANAKTAQFGRYSAVCFIQLKRTAKYDKDGSGRLQEKPAGFNYSMPLEEFAKFFK